MSSLAVGSAIGAAGALLLPDTTIANTIGLSVVLVVAVIAAARELGLVRFRLPQPMRQTNDAGARHSAGTRRFSCRDWTLAPPSSPGSPSPGTWALIALPLMTGDPLAGALVFLACWLGRAVSVWIAPLFMADAASGVDVIDAITAQRTTLRGSHVVGLGLLIGFVVWSL